MVDRFHRLGHNTVISCYDQNCDICGISATHTHSGKCFMARRIQEGDILSVDRNHRSTDMLGDTTCLTVCYMGITDRIQQRSFTMIYVSHNTDNGRTGNHILFILFFLTKQFLDYINLFFCLRNNIIIQCNLLGLFKVDFMVHSHHDSFQEQLLHNYGRLHLHLLSQLTNCQFLRKCDLLYFLFLLFLWLR